MNIAHMNGDLKVKTKAEAENFIRERSLAPFDDIWISGENQYPCLAILMNGNYACVHYFLNDEGDMWLAEGTYDEDLEVEFIAGGQKSVMFGDTIISLDKAIECVNEFFDSPERPKCTAWTEL